MKLIKHDYCSKCGYWFKPEDKKCTSCNRVRFTLDNVGRKQTADVFYQQPLTEVVKNVFAMPNIMNLLNYPSTVSAVKDVYGDVMTGMKYLKFARDYLTVSFYLCIILLTYCRAKWIYYGHFSLMAYHCPSERKHL